MGGADIFHGGNGNDQIFGGPGADQLFGGAGNDVILAGNDSDTNAIGFFSAPGNFLAGNEGNDTLIAGSGNRLLGGDGDDELITSGGVIIDSFAIDDSELILDLGENLIAIGPDLRGGISFSDLTGGEGADHFFLDGTGIVTDFNSAEGDSLEFGVFINETELGEGILPKIDIEIALGKIDEQDIAVIKLTDQVRDRIQIVGFEGDAPTAEDIQLTDQEAATSINAALLSTDSNLVITEIPVVA